MGSPTFKAILKRTAHAPRDQLDRCASLLSICMEAKKAATEELSEDGVVSSEKTKDTDFLVDRICDFVAQAADPKRYTTAPTREDWESVQVVVDSVLEVLPLKKAQSMRTELQDAVKRDETAARLYVKAKESIQKVMANSDWITVKLLFVGPETEPIEEEYEVKRHTPPAKLATMIMHRKKGRLPNFYRPNPGPIDPMPADWESQVIPERLFVVMDRGRFEFKFRITSICTITETWVFRNIFVLQQQGNFYLKDSVGGLHQAPNGNIEPNGIVCTKVQRSDQKRIEGARNCERWRETLDRILTAGDDDWIVGPEPPPPPDLPSTDTCFDLSAFPKSFAPDIQNPSIFTTTHTTGSNSSTLFDSNLDVDNITPGVANTLNEDPAFTSTLPLRKPPAIALSTFTSSHDPTSQIKQPIHPTMEVTHPSCPPLFLDVKPSIPRPPRPKVAPLTTLDITPTPSSNTPFVYHSAVDDPVAVVPVISNPTVALVHKRGIHGSLKRVAAWTKKTVDKLGGIVWN